MRPELLFRSCKQAALGLLFAVGLLLAACTERTADSPADDRAPHEPARLCDAPDVLEVVERLGEQLKQVPLLAPDSIIVREIREAYAPLGTSDLLAVWTQNPTLAPGREVSSPWPDRIEIRSVEPEGAAACRVEGDVVYMTSAEGAQETASREPVTLWVQDDDGWRINAYEAAPSSNSTSAPAEEATDVLRRYYAAINARDFQRAYALWGGEGAASGQTFEAFAAGFAETERVEVEIGKPGRVDPAAGSRYVEVPVVVRAVTVSGETQRFEGMYTLRRSVVDGASPEQRRWHLYTAEINRR